MDASFYLIDTGLLLNLSLSPLNIMWLSQEISNSNASSRHSFIGRVPQLTFTCSKSTIETLEKGVKYGQS